MLVTVDGGGMVVGRVTKCCCFLFVLSFIKNAPKSSPYNTFSGSEHYIQCTEQHIITVCTANDQAKRRVQLE